MDSFRRSIAVTRTPPKLHEAVLPACPPVNHPLIDGSGMLREASDEVISGVGDVFAMKMHNGEMGDYEMSNYVVEYELNRRISWEPVLKAASRPPRLRPASRRLLTGKVS